MGRAPEGRTGYLQTLARLSEGTKRRGYGNVGLSGAGKALWAAAPRSREDANDQHFLLCSFASDQPWPLSFPPWQLPSSREGTAQQQRGVSFSHTPPGLCALGQPCIPGRQISCGAIIGPYFTLLQSCHISGDREGKDRFPPPPTAVGRQH